MTMQVSKFDIGILVTMSLAVIIMSFLFPALGISDEASVNESDIPEFNISANTVDITGQFPDRPGTADSGRLELDEDGAGSGVRGISLKFIETPSDNGYSIELQNFTNGPRFSVRNFSGGLAADKYDYPIENTTDQTILHEADGYVIQFDVTDIENYNQSNMLIAGTWNVESGPDDADGISSIPLFGDQLDAVANIVGFLAVAFFYISLVIVEIAINTIVTLFTIAQYAFGMGYFLASTYTALVASAPGWAGVVLTAPAVMLFAVFAKFGAIVISLFPTT